MGRKSKTKPGILLYFDQAEAFKYFTDAEVGLIVRAALRFGQFGEDTTFPDRALQSIWHSIRLSLIKDHESYFRDIAAKTYSSKCNAWKDAGEEYPDKDTWIEEETQRLLSLDAERRFAASSEAIRKEDKKDTQLQREKNVITAPTRYAPITSENAPDNGGEQSRSKEQEFNEKRKKGLEMLGF